MNYNALMCAVFFNQIFPFDAQKIHVLDEVWHLTGNERMNERVSRRCKNMKECAAIGLMETQLEQIHNLSSNTIKKNKLLYSNY